MSEIIFSCIIPVSSKDIKSQKLQDLIASIKAQDFPQDQIEILTITEGDSEQAKGIGIKKAKGEICAMFCADNYITNEHLFKNVYDNLMLKGHSATFPIRYSYQSNDNSLNRYFSLIGGNDPICYYLGKNDRHPHEESLHKESEYAPSYGCNGFFYRSELIKATNLNNYYPMDNAMEVKGEFCAMDCDWIWHRTSDNLISFLIKRYKYARDLYSDRQDRRWRMLDTRQDYKRLGWFIFCTLTILPCLMVSLKGYSKVKDPAWAWHFPVCFGFLLVYSFLVLRNLFKFGNFFQVRSKNVIHQN